MEEDGEREETLGMRAEWSIRVQWQPHTQRNVRADDEVRRAAGEEVGERERERERGGPRRRQLQLQLHTAQIWSMSCSHHLSEALSTSLSHRLHLSSWAWDAAGRAVSNSLEPERVSLDASLSHCSAAHPPIVCTLHRVHPPSCTAAAVTSSAFPIHSHPLPSLSLPHFPLCVTGVASPCSHPPVFPHWSAVVSEMTRLTSSVVRLGGGVRSLHVASRPSSSSSSSSSFSLPLARRSRVSSAALSGYQSSAAAAQSSSPSILSRFSSSLSACSTSSSSAAASSSSSAFLLAVAAGFVTVSNLSATSRKHRRRTALT